MGSDDDVNETIKIVLKRKSIFFMTPTKTLEEISHHESQNAGYSLKNFWVDFLLFWSNKSFD
jgi:hypothetical protein